MRCYYETHTGKKLFSIGKFKNKSVKHVYQTNKKYIIWLKKNTDYLLPQEIEDNLKRLNINN